MVIHENGRVEKLSHLIAHAQLGLKQDNVLLSGSSSHLVNTCPCQFFSRPLCSVLAIFAV